MLNASYFIMFIQIISDIACVCFSANLIRNNKQQKLFYILSFFSFAFLAFDDIYYNYSFRILKLDQSMSGELINVVPLFIFQILQSCNWYILLKQQNVKIFTWLNLPYLLFGAAVSCVLAYFFMTTQSSSAFSTIEDVISVTLDMCVWFFTIICLGRSQSRTIALLALGCLMIASADLTMTCLYMFHKDSVVAALWPHAIWAFGAFLMAYGFVKADKKEKFTFYRPDSIHANCSWWVLIASLVAFIIGFVFPILFTGTRDAGQIQLSMWDLPISLMFTMIAATLMSNRFSNIILSPIKLFSNSIESFSDGVKPEIAVKNDINEFKILGDFIDKSFTNISEQLDKEIKIAAQVAHDIRSPLCALEIGIKAIPSTIDESIRVLLRDAAQHIRDITNMLEKNNQHITMQKRQDSQIADILDSVVSERRLALSSPNIKINQLYQSDAYSYFSNVIPSMLKRILTNLINNAHEAITHSNGVINIDLTQQDNQCVLTISDNGAGISEENMRSLFRRGFTTKQNGSGLGLHHAEEILTEWSGKIEVNSNVGIGTEVKVSLPLISTPAWFVGDLTLRENETIVCIDDSQAVYYGWLERFKSISFQPNFIYCSSKEDFLQKVPTLKYQNATYFIDFEYSGKSYQGYDFTNILLTIGNANNRIFIVTSRSGDDALQGYCVKHSIRIIPKNFSVRIPICVT